ncbi:hypothetical protein [Thiocapsa sp.]|uniref:hypothetical protein n=1 Tax=Thiocapsa sp. TaxID=2024551 RepID=UPI0035930395
MTRQLRMITLEDIKARIEPLGFAWTGDWGWGKPETRRFEGPAIPQLLGIGTVLGRSAGQSSLYIRDNYLSATGHYRKLEELVRPSTYGSLASKAPEWRGRDLLTLMDKLEELMSVNPASGD